MKVFIFLIPFLAVLIQGFFNPAPKLTELERRLLFELLDQSQLPYHHFSNDVMDFESNGEDDREYSDVNDDSGYPLPEDVDVSGKKGCEDKESPCTRSSSGIKNSARCSMRLLAVMRREYVIDSSYF